MSQGDKSKYTAKQKHKAEKIADSYQHKGVAEDEAEARAWATVNSQDGGGEKSGGGRDKTPREKAAARSDSARRAVAARRGHPVNKARREHPANKENAAGS